MFYSFERKFFMGKLIKGALKVTAVDAAVGGLCYVFKDKIKETKVYQDNNMDEKINKVKETIKQKMPKVFDNEADFDEEDANLGDVELDAEDINRDYVSINTEDTSTEEA